MKRVLFIDRDGTLIKEPEDQQVHGQGRHGSQSQQRAEREYDHNGNDEHQRIQQKLDQLAADEGLDALHVLHQAR